MAKRALTKSEIVDNISQNTEVARADVRKVLNDLADLIPYAVDKYGIFKIAGVVKFVRVRKKATKARMWTPPWSDEAIKVKAKPARNIVRARPLKNLKEAVT